MTIEEMSALVDTLEDDVRIPLVAQISYETTDERERHQLLGMVISRLFGQYLHDNGMDDDGRGKLIDLTVTAATAWMVWLDSQEKALKAREVGT